MVPSISEEASGPSYSVPRLCESLIERGEHVTLAALAWSSKDRSLPYLKTFPMSPLWPHRLGASRAMHRWLDAIATAEKPTILHNHGMWQLNSLYPAWAARRAHGSCKFVASTRGALSDWAMHQGSSTKRLFWPLLQRRALRDAACLHATAVAEYMDIRRMGFRQPVAIIPNGMDVQAPKLGDAERMNGRTLLFLGRIHPVKGLDMLLPAWARVQPRFPGWRLVIAGDDKGYCTSSGYLGEMRQLANNVGAEHITFAGQITGQGKWEAYRGAELFVLPSRSENFGVAVAEALATGTPAIVTRGAPWRGLETHHAGWWVDATIDAIAAALADAMSRPREDLAAMGERGREWVRAEFGWDEIARKMAMTYRWLFGELTDRPDWIRLD